MLLFLALKRHVKFNMIHYMVKCYTRWISKRYVPMRFDHRISIAGTFGSRQLDTLTHDSSLHLVNRDDSCFLEKAILYQ